MIGERKCWPPEESAPRVVLDLIDAHPGVTLTVLGREGRTDGGMVYNCSVLFADGREVEVEVS
jgi:hypothetical protein